MYVPIPFFSYTVTIMKKFRFDKKAPGIPFIRILKFVVGWHCLGLCAYHLAWKPRVMKDRDLSTSDWDKLSASMYYY